MFFENPVEYLLSLIKNDGQVLYMPNGGNLGDNLIAAATIQSFNKFGLPWKFMKGGKENVKKDDILVYGGGGSLVSLYTGGIACLKFLLSLKRPVVVLPQTIRGHEDFWSGVENITVFSRDQISFDYLKKFKNVQSLISHDMATNLDISCDPFCCVKYLREWYLNNSVDQTLCVYRRDIESESKISRSSLDLSEVSFPPINSVESIYSNAVFFLSALSPYSRVITDRLHVAVAAGLQGIDTLLIDNVYGKNKSIYEYSLSKKFTSIKMT